jgi:(p)ppGpp synthase/HD superfamily hydrolase
MATSRMNATCAQSCRSWSDLERDWMIRIPLGFLSQRGCTTVLRTRLLDRETIAQEFGEYLGELVWRVTQEPGRSRKERKPGTYRKIRELEDAIILKLADRIANVEASARNTPGLFRMYVREQADFDRALHAASRSEIASRMWNYLDECLKYER